MNQEHGNKDKKDQDDARSESKSEEAKEPVATGDQQSS